ncbi:MAG: DNA primase [Sulfurimonadaceae bacterium]|jgi:DNA primase|nr:DNA primase [Sulfurimonadaceae bacterium]
MISQDSIEALKGRLDIVDVVGSYIELKKAGVNFKAICPFHSEKTPSLVVSPAKQIYHCFSCGAGGDSIKFVMEIEKLNYPEAIEKLAANYNFTLNYTDNNKPKPKTNLLQAINSHYKKLLSTNRVALEYIKSRAISQGSIERFELGYASSSHATLDFLKSNFLTLSDAIDAGVVGSGESGYYARLVDRIIFPIFAPNGSIVGFGGRTITNHPAKYINSPQTQFFDKSKILYAYNLAKDAIYKNKQIIITEGYLDVIMLHQAGFNTAVATLGTALTPQHLPLLRKGEPQVIMAYDGDNAGRAAAKKASQLLSAGGFGGGVVLLGASQDPADMVVAGRVVELESLFKHPKPFIEYVIDETIGSFDISDPLQKQSALEEITEFLKTLTPLLQESYRAYVSQKLGAINPSLIRLKKAKTTQTQTQTAHQDSWEQMIIKTLLEQPHLLDMFLDVLDSSYFRFHSKELEFVVSSRLDEPELMAILLDESIKSLKNEDELKSELIVFLIKHYEGLLKKVNSSSDISFEQKAFTIRKYRNRIARLKSGKLEA